MQDAFKSYTYLNANAESQNLVHYGVPGQKWYERRFQNEDGSLTDEGRRHYGIGDRIRQLRDQDAHGVHDAAREHHEIQQRRKERTRKVAAGIIAVGAAATAIAAYKHVKMTKAKAYSGLLARFTDRNLGSIGGANFQQGLRYARENSKSYSVARQTNRYLKRTGSKISKTSAKRIYSSRRLMERLSKINSGSSNFSRKLNQYRRIRMRNKIFDRLYF